MIGRGDLENTFERNVVRNLGDKTTLLIKVVRCSHTLTTARVAEQADVIEINLSLKIYALEIYPGLQRGSA